MSSDTDGAKSFTYYDGDFDDSPGDQAKECSEKTVDVEKGTEDRGKVENEDEATCQETRRVRRV